MQHVTYLIITKSSPRRRTMPTCARDRTLIPQIGIYSFTAEYAESLSPIALAIQRRLVRARQRSPSIAPIASSPRCIGPSCASLVGETHATCGRPPYLPSPRGTLCIRDAQLPRRDVGVERGFHPDERARVFTDASEIARFAHSKFVNVPRVRSIASMFAFNSPVTGTY